jgi:hypothetical protein
MISVLPYRPYKVIHCSAKVHGSHRTVGATRALDSGRELLALGQLFSLLFPGGAPHMLTK